MCHSSSLEIVAPWCQKQNLQAASGSEISAMFVKMNPPYSSRPASNQYACILGWRRLYPIGDGTMCILLVTTTCRTTPDPTRPPWNSCKICTAGFGEASFLACHSTLPPCSLAHLPARPTTCLEDVTIWAVVSFQPPVLVYSKFSRLQVDQFKLQKTNAGLNAACFGVINLYTRPIVRWMSHPAATRHYLRGRFRVCMICGTH